MRLFVALVPPESLVERLAEVVQPRREASPGLRWTDPHQWHVTLAFMGSAPERSVDDLVERLGRAAARSAPLPLSVGGAGAFPHVGAARVLYAGVSDASGRLPRLVESVRAACSRAGAAPEGGRFHPHVTLARFSRPAEATRWIRALDGYAEAPWTADRLTLVESHLGQGRGGRPSYEVVAELALGARAAGETAT